METWNWKSSMSNEKLLSSAIKWENFHHGTQKWRFALELDPCENPKPRIKICTVCSLSVHPIEDFPYGCSKSHYWDSITRVPAANIIYYMDTIILVINHNMDTTININ
jgi:hypothetical protein